MVRSEQALLLSNALPYMRRYEGKTVVIKYGGHAMVDVSLGKVFARDVALLHQSGIQTVVVHGGGPQIATMLSRMGIKSKFCGGLRVTDKETIEIVEMILAGSINKGIVANFNTEGARAIGLCGKDGNMVTVTKELWHHRDPNSCVEQVIDLGFVGKPKIVDVEVLNKVVGSGLIPIIAPVALGEDGETYNVNADTFAGAIAAAIDAERLLFLTDVPGVLDQDSKIIKHLSIKEARSMIEGGLIYGGMIPKVETCIEALNCGVEAVVIVNGKVPHALLLELFTDHGAGTMIVN
ncbi:acetylglutamate kinase [Candidatus Endowatersipora endosymbiont of Watersipora subatra]|uniref:acetylglutamate kinase n=1 Tax=Candidatus Endowatersipora endosymbiont of Watersipora subatra TaxID=3077946 RepID=UPI00312CBC30